MTQRFRILLACAALLPLMACALHQSAPDDLYVLKAEQPAISGKTQLAGVRVIKPQTAPGLDNAHIAVREAPNRLTYYTGVAWVRPLPDMLQSFMVDALTQSHAFKSVSSDKEGILTDRSLVTDINDYSVEANEGNPTVRVTLVIKLVNDDTHKVITSFMVEKSVAAGENKTSAIIRAFNQATDDAMSDILAQLTHRHK